MIRALYGGSFDPVHAGHVALVSTLLQRGLADIVHVVPARQSPFKPGPPGASATDRLHLAELAFAHVAGAEVDPREIGRSGPSYTVDTLGELVRKYGDAGWRLIVGADTVADFSRWRDPERLLDLALPLVVARGPVTLVPPLAGHAEVLEDFDHPASAARIRGDLAAGILPGPDLLPPTVAAAIATAGLYGWPGHRTGS